MTTICNWRLRGLTSEWCSCRSSPQYCKIGADALVVHGRIFCFACDNIQPITLDEFVYCFITAEQLNTIFPT